MEEQKQHHGGKREGAGRKPTLDGGKRTTVFLDAETIARAKALGNGNLSVGLRIAVRNAAAVQPTTQETTPAIDVGGSDRVTLTAAEEALFDSCDEEPVAPPSEAVTPRTAAPSRRTPTVNVERLSDDSVKPVSMIESKPVPEQDLSELDAMLTEINATPDDQRVIESRGS